MGKIVVTLKILPSSPEVDMAVITKKAEEILVNYGKLYKKTVQPIAFGLSSLNISLIMEEGKAKPDDIEAKLKEIEDVQDAQLSDVTKLADVSFG